MIWFLILSATASTDNHFSSQSTIVWRKLSFVVCSILPGASDKCSSLTLSIYNVDALSSLPCDTICVMTGCLSSVTLYHIWMPTVARAVILFTIASRSSHKATNKSVYISFVIVSRIGYLFLIICTSLRSSFLKSEKRLFASLASSLKTRLSIVITRPEK